MVRSVPRIRVAMLGSLRLAFRRSHSELVVLDVRRIDFTLQKCKGQLPKSLGGAVLAVAARYGRGGRRCVVRSPIAATTTDAVIDEA